jgi:enterochelin esterase-like enzyme
LPDRLRSFIRNISITEYIFFRLIYQIILDALYKDNHYVLIADNKQYLVIALTHQVCLSLFIFDAMPIEKTACIIVEHYLIKSAYLKREVKVDCYLPVNVEQHADMSLLLINDGQDLVTMEFENILDKLYQQNAITPLLCIGLHCGADRKNEYATANIIDYKGRGAKAALYTQFVLEELLPFVRKTYLVFSFKKKSYAGFSLGGLSALDIVWNNPKEFAKVGVFSGSFWWRDKDQAAIDFDESKNRIMHRQVQEGNYAPWLKFFFEVGTQDETADRNNNGIIDAIDDTISLIDELKQKGYSENNIEYIELQDGRHDVPTWSRAFPSFLLWGWGKVASCKY